MLDRLLKKAVRIEQIPVGNFRDTMVVADLFPLQSKRWSLGRLRYMEVTVWTPLGRMGINLHDQFGDDVLPHHIIHTHLTLQWGRARLPLT